MTIQWAMVLAQTTRDHGDRATAPVCLTRRGAGTPEAVVTPK